MLKLLKNYIFKKKTIIENEVKHLLYSEYNIEQDSSFVFNSFRLRPSIISVNNNRTFVYKKTVFDTFNEYNENAISTDIINDDIAKMHPTNPLIKYALSKRQRIGKKYSALNVTKQYETCLSTSLTPNIISQTKNFYEITHYDTLKYRKMTPNDLLSLNLKDNIDKFKSYAACIANQDLRIDEFNIDEFIIHNDTHEIIFMGITHIEYNDLFFNINIFYKQSNSSYIFFVRDLFSDNINKIIFEEYINVFYDRCNIKKIFFKNTI